MDRLRSFHCAVAFGLVSLFALVTPVGGQQCLRQMNIPEWQEDEASGARFVAVADGYAYTTYCRTDTGEGVLSVFDVRTSSEPVEMGELEMCLEELVVSGRYVYADRRNLPPYVGYMGVQVIDVSDPRSPTDVALIRGVGQIGAISGEYAFTFSSEGMWVIDISNPTSPTEVGFLATGSYRISGLSVSGAYAYVATGGTGHHYPTYLRVVDVSDPASPVPVALVQVSSEMASMVAVSGHYAYVGSGFPWSGNVTVIDVSNPAEPAVVGQVDWMGFPRALAAAGRLLYLIQAYESGFSSLSVYNVSDPADLVCVGWLQSDYLVYFRVGGDVVPHWFDFSDFCLCGRYVYAVSDRGDFVVFDSWSCSHPYYRPPIARPQVE